MPESTALGRESYDMAAEPLLRGLLQREDLKRGVLADIEVALADVERLRANSVPVDEPAVERAGQALYEMSQGKSWPGVVHGVEAHHVGFREVVELVFRAAGETD